MSPARCSVQRRRVRMLSSERRVEAIEVELGEGTYRLQIDGHDVTTTRGKTVGGVTIKREELGDMRDPSGRVVVKCEFCSTEYAYDDRDLDRIYASAA